MPNTVPPLRATRLRDSIDPGIAGLLLSQAFSFLDMLRVSTKIFINVESMMNAVERLHEYSFLEDQEAPAAVPADKLLDPAWPSAGRLEFEGYAVRYRPGLPLVLSQCFEPSVARRVSAQCLCSFFFTWF